MIIESIVTTSNADGTVNISPMGPYFAEPGNWDQFELRPFDTSTTYRNLVRLGQGVLHIHDDVRLFAAAVTRQLDWQPRTQPADVVAGFVLSDACRAYEFEVSFADHQQPRKRLTCKTVKVHRFRDFLGFNRARHAVLEAAIVVSRLDFLPAEEVSATMQRLASIVEKTSGPDEQAAFEILQQAVLEQGKRAGGD